MYTKFFGFKENPFMLAPNPAYLFLGKSHEEALAHLIYAVSEGEGFISLIGRRGVGKTTVCQAFIDRRDDTTQVAYIFKPEVSPEELLKTINAEFGIGTTGDDSKDLIDRLNSYLMRQRVEGKKVLLFIDDAQNLNADVLEQVRLLSNLETTREKLLQIVLVGEPELADMLASRALRQIGQRVSVSYYIKPLTYEETCAYIYHRMSIASLGTQTHFAASALKRIFKFSGGIPRMINVACDKSLFTAYRFNHGHITGEIAQTALRGLAPSAGRRGWGFMTKRRVLATAAGCCLLLILMLAAFSPWRADLPAVGSRTATPPATAGPADSPVAIPPPAARAPEPMAKLDSTVVEGSSNAMEPDEETPPPAAGALPEAPEAAEKPADTAPSPAVPDKPSEPVITMTHSVQVGAFRRMHLARKLAGALKQKGYPASILPVYDSQDRTWFTVRIGDFPSRKAAVQRADEFTSRENMETAVRPFEKL